MKNRIENRILVAIASYGTKNSGFLGRLLDEYRGMALPVDVVVNSNVPKDLGADVEVVVGLPSSDPRSLTFAHRTLFADRRDDYDVFVYSEEDTLVTARNIEAFLDATGLLPSEYVAGFMRYEVHPSGRRSYCTVHSHYHWDPASTFRAGSACFASFTNLHAACFMLTRDQLHRAISSSGFLVAPHSGRYGMLESGATDPYSQCGFTKVIRIDAIDDFLLHHLPNVYLGRMGIDETEFRAQLEALVRIERGEAPSSRLFRTETSLDVDHEGWNKCYYEPPLPSVLERVAARSVCTIGCGAGTVESELLARGSEVVGIPVDEVIGAVASSRGIEVLPASFEEAFELLAGRTFDRVLLLNTLQFLADPVALLRRAARLLNDRGRIVLYAPNHKFHALRAWRRARAPMLTPDVPFERSNLQYTDARVLRGWLRDAGLVVESLSYRVADKARGASRATLGVLDAYLGDGIIVVGRLR